MLCLAFVLVALAPLGPAVAQASTADSSATDPLPVTSAASLKFPLSAVGQLSNGCTGYLIGPCHVMTVAHCVYEPWRHIWYRGLEFHPGRNVDAQGGGWSPLGSAAKQDVRLHPNWTSDSGGTKGQPASDAAIVIIATPIGRKVGWFRPKLPENAGTPARLHGRRDVQGQQQQQSLAALVGAAALPLHIAGYPDNRVNGSMWRQCCTILDWQLQGNLLWHDCYARGGNSGSPVWVVWPGQPMQTNRSSSSNSDSSQRVQVVGVHSSSLQFPKDSQIGVYAQELYAQAIANARQGLQSGTRRLAYGTCSPGTSTADTTDSSSGGSSSTSSTGHNMASSSNSSKGNSSRGGSGISSNRAGGSTDSTDSTAAGGSSYMAKNHGRSLLAGAGGREGDGEHVLLPVAVPFTGDTYAWIDQVLKEFSKCPGE